MILSQLNHPNIATVYDFDTQQGVDLLVMEYIPGITLNEKLAANSRRQETPSIRPRQRRRITTPGWLAFVMVPLWGRKHLQRTDTHTARALLRGIKLKGYQAVSSEPTPC